MARFVVTSRVGPKVSRTRFETLDDALAALGRLVDGARTRAPARRVLGRDYAAGDQIAGRHEVRGPGVRGGIDLRGDGTAQAFTGWIRRAPVEPRPGEDALEALGRELRG